ncbi:hypothetical protein MPSEU_000970700 [Mayamaea pseudoterrestris]|nr:hypothetical protein MPSEU_000970700 [Mayamaea pseudoterrestris]
MKIGGSFISVPSENPPSSAYVRSWAESTGHQSMQLGVSNLASAVSPLTVDRIDTNGEPWTVNLKLGIMVTKDDVDVHEYRFEQVPVAPGDWQGCLEAIKTRGYDLYKRRIPTDRITLSYVDKTGDLLPVTCASELKLAFVDAQPNLMKIVAQHNCWCASYIATARTGPASFCTECWTRGYFSPLYSLTCSKTVSGTRYSGLHRVDLCGQCRLSTNILVGKVSQEI